VFESGRPETGGYPLTVGVENPNFPRVALRDRLIADLAQLQSSDEAADWVHKNMPLRTS
jgi:hypothetical protein